MYGIKYISAIEAADEIMELLLAVNRRGNTVLLVTHEQRYADLCGRKIEISGGKIAASLRSKPIGI